MAAIILPISSLFVDKQAGQSAVLRFGWFSRFVGPLSFGYRTDKPGNTTVYALGDLPRESVMAESVFGRAEAIDLIDKNPGNFIPLKGLADRSPAAGRRIYGGARPHAA